MRTIDLHENGIYIRFAIMDDNTFKLLHFSALPLHDEDLYPNAVRDGFPFVSINLAGYDRPTERHGNKFIVTAPGYRMKYDSHTMITNEYGRLLTIVTFDEETEVYVTSHMQFYQKLPVIRIWHRVTNHGKESQTLDYIANFHYEGIEKEGRLPRDEKLKLYLPHNSWQREMNWKCHTLPELGLLQVQPSFVQRSSNLVRVSNTGNWSTKEYLPMGYLENTECKNGIFWQIEHNGSWHWEIGGQNQLYLALGGPNELYSHWYKNLAPGDSFETVPAAVGVTALGFDDAMGTLTDYRRIIRRKNEDNLHLPVIFNDYMNCLWGNPTAAEEFPLIDVAAEAGCEYFCIDAGWYADGHWWDSVGIWEESRVRFPNGLKEVTDYILSKGMVPGVWLEPEVMGIHCPLTEEFTDDCLFTRHGRRVYDRSRLQLDYRNPKVIRHMDQVIDRLVNDYHIGYIKTDYNIEPGIGTDYAADSPGDGMLMHERSYLKWLDSLFARYPHLVIENCSSGGMRIDYAMLSRISIQSTSDQEEYLKYAVIAANSPTGVTPEQAAVWSYPMNHEADTCSPEDLREETIFNMVNALLLRIHQSGHLAKLDEERKKLVREGISLYKQIRPDIRVSRPFWPLGLAGYEDTWVCLGLDSKDHGYLAVWKRSGDSGEIQIPLPEKYVSAECIYPVENDVDYTNDTNTHMLILRTSKEIMARLFLLKIS